MVFHLLVLWLLCWQLGHATIESQNSFQKSGAMLASFEQVKAGCAGLHSVALWSALGPPDGKGVQELQRACHWVERIQAESDIGSNDLLQVASRDLAEDDDEKVQREDVPWFADSRESYYPLLTVLIWVLVSFLVILFWEVCWLRSTMFSAGLWYKAKAVEILKQPADAENSAKKSSRCLSISDSTQYWNNAQKVLSDTKPQIKEDKHTSYLRFTRRAYKAHVDEGKVTIEVQRTGPCDEEVHVQILTQDRDQNNLAARAGSNYKPTEETLVFKSGQRAVSFDVPLLETYCWESTKWFRVEFGSVTVGNAKLYPQTHTRVFVIDKSLYPGKIPPGWSQRTHGMRRLLLGYYFMRECEGIRGPKFWKTLIAMMYPPVHNVVVTSLMQKFIITFVANKEFMGETYESAIYDILFLAIVQFISTCILRWSDKVQVCNRGRTGGIRQTHRLHLLDKMLILGHDEHMHYKGVDWLYAAVNDTNSIVLDIYWQFFVAVQAVESLVLTFLLLIFWDVASVTRKGETYHLSKLAPSITFIVILPLTTFLIWRRRRAVFDHVEHRAQNEASWMNIFAWLSEVVHYIYGFGYRELASVEALFKSNNKSFVKEHQRARDTMNDSIAIAIYMGAIGYILILVWGGWGLLNNTDNNDQPETLEAGHYVLLLKLFSNFGKYMVKVQGSLVKFQRGCVNLERLQLLLNHQEVGRGLVKTQTLQLKDGGQCPGNTDDTKDARERSIDNCILLKSACLKVSDKRYGIGPFCSVFTRSGSEICFPLGKMVHLKSCFEARVLSIMAMAAGVVEPSSGTLHAPEYVWRVMLPTQPVSSFGDLTSADELEMAGATNEQASRLLSAFEIDPDLGARHLWPGACQVLALLRAMLRDPEVLVVWKPCSFISEHLQKPMWTLIRIWQKCGGAKAILQLGESGDPSSSSGLSIEHDGKYRTVILSTSHETECDFNPADDVSINLDEFWAKEEDVIAATQTKGEDLQQDPSCYRVDGESLPEAKLLGNATTVRPSVGLNNDV